MGWPEQLRPCRHDAFGAWRHRFMTLKGLSSAGALVLAWAMLGAACASVPLPPLSLDPGLDLPEGAQRVAQAARQAVVSIFYEYGEGAGGGRRSGSGFLVEPRLIVTDYHVVWGQPRFLTILGPDGRLGPRGRLDTVSQPYDLALIVLEKDWRPGPPLPMATQVLPGSMAVALAGRWVPTACSRHTSLVRLNTVVVADPSKSELLILPPTQVCRGFSGGPVLNMQGEVIGVVRAGVRARLPTDNPRNETNTSWVAATSVRHVREAIDAFHHQPR